MERPLGITVNRHIIDSQRMHPEATGELSGLLSELIIAAKTISAEVNMAGLADIIGLSGKSLSKEITVQALDDFANNTIKRRMARSGYICAMASEEEDGLIPVHEGYEGNYTLAIDPLDGISNIDVNVSIGTVFSIHRRRSSLSSGRGNQNDLLQKGCDQIAAGYMIYGSSTMLVFSTGNGVNGFTLDPSVGEFFLSHPNIQIPENGIYFSINEGNYHYWDNNMRRYVDWIKEIDEPDCRPMSCRYIGTLVSDFHRNLLKGGIFLYPRDKKNRKKLSGKIKLLYEAAPFAFIVEQAGGRAITGDGRDISAIQPERLDQCVPLIIGSKNDVSKVEDFLFGKR